MLPFALGIIVLIALVAAAGWYTSSDVRTLRRALQWLVLVLLAAAAIFLAVTGRLGAAAAALAGLFAWAWRILSLIQMGQQIGGMFGRARRAGSPESTAAGRMTEEEAYRILGLVPGATENEIKEAYKRLMSQVHPDHGGTDYLAAKINAAKDFLLKNK